MSEGVDPPVQDSNFQEDIHSSSSLTLTSNQTHQFAHLKREDEKHLKYLAHKWPSSEGQVRQLQ